jgi:hypothetical protein
MDDDATRIDASQRDEARHSLTTAQAAEVFAQLGVPRSKRSVQRFCEAGHLDFVSVKGPRSDEFFISRQSVERYAEELRQIDASATIGDEARHDAPERDTARHDAPKRDSNGAVAPNASEPQRDHGEEGAELKRREDEILNLRIDNRAKEQVITMLRDERREMQIQLQDVTYRLGSSETRIALLEAAKPDGDTARHGASGGGSEPTDTMAEVTATQQEPITTRSPVSEPAAERSFLGRLFG